MMPIKRTYGQNWLPNIFNDFFDNDWMVKANATAPSINVIENSKNYIVEVAAPGMTKDDFNIHLTDNNELIISMEKKSENKNEEDKKYLRCEFSYSKFQQSLILPEDVDKEKIGAHVQNGVLSIELPKHSPEEKAKVDRIIEIQ